MVRDQGTPSRHSLARVVINVHDYNDHAPKFIASHFEGRIFRNAEVGTVALTVTAMDNDHGDNAKIEYMILSGIVLISQYSLMQQNIFVLLVCFEN